ncbi:substrate-binding periplasmic protein [Hahella ganghwensis]|uniref:substrate-binding periplasmic protein n=1 Tax=Hahella ganghwensis TaxID=286420 RepID=UPI000367C54F|nr:transporter substrate-binding domain-containing protein [Hahella ganghwensis]
METSRGFSHPFTTLVWFRAGLAVCSLLLAFSTNAETIHIATGEYPPWASQQLPHEGVISHVIAESFKEAGIQVEFHYFPWARSYDLARQGQHDAASYWACSEKHQEDFYCSTPIIQEETVFFHLKSSSFTHWMTLDDLRPFKIGATAGYTYTPEFWEAAESGRITVDTVSEDIQSFRMLIYGRVDLSIMGKIAGLRLLRSRFSRDEASQIIYDPQPLVLQPMSLLFPKAKSHSLQLLFLFNRGFEKLKESGVYDELMSDLITGKYD